MSIKKFEEKVQHYEDKVASRLAHESMIKKSVIKQCFMWLLAFCVSAVVFYYLFLL